MVEGESNPTATASVEQTAPGADPGATTPAARAPIAARRAILPGDPLGPYTVSELLGSGGMGQVFVGIDHRLGRTVALKVIRPDRRATSSAARARLVREAQALAQLRHPNVVTVHDVGAEGDVVFIAMEHLEGVTLAQWLAAAPRTWRQVRDVFVAAGRGLAAAHAAGIVHRDFKPQNVLVTADRVVVLDFGLARAEAEEEQPATEPGDELQPDEHGDEHGDEPGDELQADEDDAPPPRNVGPPAHGLAVSLTRTGERVGTPHYMAPEQRAGAAVTAKADQFAFCVALRDALHGEPSSDGASDALRLLVRPVVLVGARPPRAVAPAIERGLSPDPDARWPSMDALLAAIGHDFWTRRRTRIATAVAGAAALGLAGLAFAAGQRAAAPAICPEGDDPQLAALWSEPTRTDVQAAFRRTGLPFAEDTFARVDASVRSGVTGWSRAMHQSCEATHVLHTQSVALLDLRAQCLGRARSELVALIQLLRNADHGVVERATRATIGLADMSRCDDPSALGIGIAPPSPVQRPEVEAVRLEATRISPLFELGRVGEAKATARAAVARARAVGYKPLLAKVLSQLAHVETNSGEIDQAIADLHEVAQLGAEVGDDDVVAKVLPWLVFAVGYGRDRYDEADQLYRWATAAVARSGNVPVRVSGLLGNRAVVLGRRGDHRGALELYRRLLPLETARMGPESLGVAWSLRSIGEEMMALGQTRDARPYLERGSAMIERVLGPDHPMVATLRYVYGFCLLELRELAPAVAVLERSVQIYERSLGPDDLRIAATLEGVGIGHLGLRHLREARAALERSVRIYRASDPESRDLAASQDVLSDVARREGDPRAAYELARQALAHKLRLLAPDHESVGQSYRIGADHLAALGRIGEARAAIERALAIAERAHGNDHPEYAWSQFGLGEVLRAEGKPREALAAYQRALEILERRYGAESSALVQPLGRLVEAHLALGQAALAEPLAVRAAALAPRAAPEDPDAAAFRLAQVRHALGADRPAALAQARQARARLAALPFPFEDLPRFDRWLSTAR